MRVGRPLKFKSVEEIQPLIDKYFEETPKEEQAITGLALALDTCRSTLCEHEGRDEFSNTIKRAKGRIELAYEQRMIKRGNAGDIFGLKNLGWADKQEITQHHTGSLSLGKAFENLKDDKDN